MRLCHLDDLPDGGARGFDPQRPGAAPMLVVRRGRQVHGYVDACPHQGTPLAWRRDAYLDAARERIVCAAHGALFEIGTGRCVLGPCLGDALTPVALTLTDDGEVHLAANTPQETHP